MSWHNFIFSDKTGDRIKRHLSFWLLWWIYFAGTYYYYGQVGQKEITFGSLGGLLILKTLILLAVHMVSCYAFIYILLPRYFLEKHYISLTAFLLLLIGVLLVAGYVIHFIVFPILDRFYSHNQSSNTKMIWWTNVNSILLNAPKIIAAATAIKLVKRWYLKQQEKERIEKEKLITDLQLLKAQMRPDFLFASLDQIYRYTEQQSMLASELLLKFSDLLSYMLYECDAVEVFLEKEIAMTKEYMLLEKMRYGKSIDIEVSVRGDSSGKEIAPLILLPFIENSFRQCAKLKEQPWINLDITVGKEALVMKIMNGIDAETVQEELRCQSAQIQNVQKRLSLLYEDKHELKMYADGEIYISIMKIELKRKPYLGSQVWLASENSESLSDYAVN